MDLSFIDNILNNEYINIILIVFVILYQCILLPKLPKVMIDVADNTMFKVLILTLIAFIANRNLRVSLLIAIVFLLTLNIANTNL